MSEFPNATRTELMAYAELQANALEFAREVAALRPDGEGTDAEGDAWVMENDDAVETLNGLIYQARNFLMQPQDQPERWEPA